MKKILVLGGTGAIGEHLVTLLAGLNNEVVVTTRAKRCDSQNVRYVQGTAQDINFLVHLLAQQWDAIVDFMIYTTSKFEERFEILLSNTEQYIYLSSARVYADSSEPIKENSPRLLDSSSDTRFLSTDEYSLSKARQEDILRKSGSSNWTIIRPYITYSEQRLQLGVLEKEAWLYRALKQRTIVFSEDMAAKLSTLTYGLDVSSAIAALVGEPEALGQAYHVTQRQAVSWRKVLDIYLNVLEQHLGKRPKVLFLGLDDFTQCKRAEYQIRYDRLFNRIFDNSKVSKYIDTSSFRAYEDGLVQCLEEFLNKPCFHAIDWRYEAIKDRYTGEWTNLSEPKSWSQKLKYLLYRFIRL